MKRLHSDPLEQHNEWGATSASKAGERGGSSHRFCGCLKSRVPSLEEMLLFLSLTHTHLSLQRDSSAARRVRAAGLATRQSARVCATGDAWMARMYVQDV